MGLITRLLLSLALLVAVVQTSEAATPIRVGSASVNASAGDGSTSVTVPLNATAVVAFWSHFDSNGNTSLATLTLNGAGFTIQAQIAEGAVSNETGTGVATLISPATGSQTVAWTWSAGAARTDGGEILLIFVENANLGDLVRGTALDAGVNTDNVTVTVTSETDDLLLAYATGQGAPALDPTVFLNDVTVNTVISDTSQVTPSATSTAVNMTGENFSSMAAITLKASATGSVQGCYLLEDNASFYNLENNTDQYALEGGGTCGGAPPANTHPGWTGATGWF